MAADSIAQDVCLYYERLIRRCHIPQRISQNQAELSPPMAGR